MSGLGLITTQLKVIISRLQPLVPTTHSSASFLLFWSMPSEKDKVTCDICKDSFYSRGFNQHHRACKAKQEEKRQLRTYQAKLAATAKLSRNAPRIEGEEVSYSTFLCLIWNPLGLHSPQNEASDTINTIITPCDKTGASRSSRTEWARGDWYTM